MAKKRAAKRATKKTAKRSRDRGMNWQDILAAGAETIARIEAETADQSRRMLTMLENDERPNYGLSPINLFRQWPATYDAIRNAQGESSRVQNVTLGYIPDPPILPEPIRDPRTWSGVGPEAGFCETERSLFNAAIASEETDAKLIYADWLEERGDDRASMIRLACEVNLGHVAKEPELQSVRTRIENAMDYPMLILKAVYLCLECQPPSAPYRFGDTPSPCLHVAKKAFATYCVRCHGADGQKEKCEFCEGTGFWLESFCYDCRSPGEYARKDCEKCAGVGRVESVLAPYWRWMLLTFDRRASLVRQGTIRAVAWQG